MRRCSLWLTALFLLVPAAGAQPSNLAATKARLAESLRSEVIVKLEHRHTRPTLVRRDAVDLSPRACILDGISCGETLLRQLTVDDCELNDGSVVDFFEFVGEAGELVVIDMTSSEVDPFLFLLDPSPQLAAVDDDGGLGTDARIEHELEQTGIWTIAANAGAGQTGSYELALGCSQTGDCIGRSSVLRLQHNRFRLSGEASLQGQPAPFFLQNLCPPGGVSPTAAAFFFNLAAVAVQEGLASVRDNCSGPAQAFVVELASASTRGFAVEVCDTWINLCAVYGNSSPGTSAFIPADRFSFAAASCGALPP